MTGVISPIRCRQTEDEPPVWDSSWGQRPESVTLLYRQGPTTVYRVRGRFQTLERYILKVSTDPGRIAREMSLYETVVRRIAVRTPDLVGGRADVPRPFIVYEDDDLRPVRKTAGRFKEIASIMARVHATDLRGVSLPPDAQSHTPPLTEVARAAAAFWMDRDAHALPAGRASYDLRVRLQDFAATAFDDLPLIGEAPSALLHGDLHLGNVMVARKSAHLFLIDWEFVHVNSPYFDLLQLFDATSPFVALKGPANRMEALAAYMEAAAIPAVRQRAYARAYLFYAGLHLIWILSRIRSDSAAGRFEPAAMARQTRETWARLRGLADDFTWLGR